MLQFDILYHSRGLQLKDAAGEFVFQGIFESDRDVAEAVSANRIGTHSDRQFGFHQNEIVIAAPNLRN